MATVRKLKFQDRLFYIILYFLLGVFCFSTLYPFIYFLVLSQRRARRIAWRNLPVAAGIHAGKLHESV